LLGDNVFYICVLKQRTENKKYFWKDIFFPNVKSANAVKDISFKINKGESVAFLGPNGAGKKNYKNAY
jgi:ABC-type uncharacterized transport system ATPase subunit